MAARLMVAREATEFFAAIPQQELMLLHGQHQITVQQIYPSTKKKTLMHKPKRKTRR